jgi:hypothetical protein
MALPVLFLWYLLIIQMTCVEPCLGGTFRASGEQDGASHRSSACHLEVVTTETAGVR